MAKTLNRLTPLSIKNLTEPGRYPDGGGLYLYINRKRIRSWVLRFVLHGKRRDMGLGSVAEKSLPQARQLAKDNQELISKGIDPIEARRAAKAAPAPALEEMETELPSEEELTPKVPTLGEIADDLIDSMKAGWRGKSTEKSWRRSFSKYALAIRDLPVDQIGEDEILSVLRPIWMTKPETADKLRGRLEKALALAKKRRLRTGDNPAVWKGNLELDLPTQPKLIKGHHRAIPYAEIPAFMTRLRAKQPISARALEWTILTVAREAMTTEATWRQIVGDFWIVQAKGMKEEEEHIVPLPQACLDILDKVRPKDVKPDALIFPGSKPGRGLSNNTMDKLLDHMGVDAVPHGFRSTFRDWAGDCTDFPEEIAEHALAHQVGDETSRAYRRGRALVKRRQLMNDWADFCATPPQSKETEAPSEEPPCDLQIDAA